MTDKLILNYTPVAAGQIDSPPLPDLVWKSGRFVPGEVFC